MEQFEEEIEIQPATIEMSGNSMLEATDENLNDLYETVIDFEDVKLEVYRHKRRRGRYSNNAFVLSYSQDDFPIYIDKIADDCGAGEYMIKFSHIEDGKKSYTFDGRQLITSANVEANKNKSVATASGSVQDELKQQKEINNRLVELIMSNSEKLAQALVYVKAQGNIQQTQTPAQMLQEHMLLTEQIQNLKQNNSLDTIASMTKELLPLFLNNNTNQKKENEVETQKSLIGNNYKKSLEEELKKMTGEE